MGRPKTELVLEGRTLLQYALDNALASRLDEIVVQIVHGPLDPSGALDGSRVETVAMSGDDTGRFTGDFSPTGAGPWGVAVRAMPTHATLSSPFETGPVALG